MFRFSQPVRRVAWTSLNHAYGKAADVPDMLEDWLADDAETRLDSYHRIISTLWHQGTIYQATAYAVPFLVEILCSADAPCRARAGTALALIAVSAAHGTAENEGHGRHVLMQLAKSTQPLLDTAVHDSALRKIVVVLLAQLKTESSFVQQRLQASGLTDDVLLLQQASKDHASAFACIKQYGDESDPSDEPPAQSAAAAAESAKRVADDVDALDWDASWEE